MSKMSVIGLAIMSLTVVIALLCVVVDAVDRLLLKYTELGTVNRAGLSMIIAVFVLGLVIFVIGRWVK